MVTRLLEDKKELLDAAIQKEFPIRTINGLEKLESDLENRDYEQKLIEYFSNIMGVTGMQKLSKIMFMLMKKMIADECFQKCTWKGIKGCTKTPFSKYLKIRSLIFNICYLEDSTCTPENVDEFLQFNVIKHSTQRLKRKRYKLPKEINPIWLYFNKSATDLSKVICKVCDKSLSLGSTEPRKQTLAGVKQHLAKFHDAENKEVLKRQTELEEIKMEAKQKCIPKEEAEEKQIDPKFYPEVTLVDTDSATFSNITQ